MKNNTTILSALLIISFFFNIALSSFTTMYFAEKIFTRENVGNFTSATDLMIFFKPDAPKADILNTMEDIQSFSSTESISYTSSEQAVADYSNYVKEFGDKQLLAVINEHKLEKLPPSLNINLKSQANIFTLVDYLSSLKVKNSSVTDIILYGQKV